MGEWRLKELSDRKEYNAQYALIAMIKKWKKSLVADGMLAAVMMDQLKAIDTINHELLIAKLHVYGFKKRIEHCKLLSV